VKARTGDVSKFGGAICTGEQFGRGVQDDYLAVRPPDFFAVEAMGRHWGVVPIRLPEFEKQNPDRASVPENTERIMAIMLLHDASTIWKARRHYPTVDWIWWALDGSGWRPVTWSSPDTGRPAMSR